MLLLERVSATGAQVHNGRHVSLVEGGQHGRRLLGFYQPPGDGLSIEVLPPKREAGGPGRDSGRYAGEPVSLQQAGEVLRAYRDWIDDGPDELATAFGLFPAPPEPFVLLVDIVP